MSVAPGRHVVAVAMASLAVAVVPGCGVPGRRRRVSAVYGRVAVVWLRHADEC